MTLISNILCPNWIYNTLHPGPDSRIGITDLTVDILSPILAQIYNKLQVLNGLLQRTRMDCQNIP